MNFKKWITPGNIIFLVVLGLFIRNQLPTIENNFQKEGSGLSPTTVRVISDGNVATFPPANGKAIAIFWSTTCAPCKLEMARLKKSVEEGKIPEERLFAINSYESNSTIKKFLKKNPFPFTFIQDKAFATALGVRGTPTTIFIDNGKIATMKTGMSIIGIWKAESFLSD